MVSAAQMARMAAIAPKTISSQIDWGPRKELRTTQILREHIAQLSNFIVFSGYLLLRLLQTRTAALAILINTLSNIIHSYSMYKIPHASINCNSPGIDT